MFYVVNAELLFTGSELSTHSMLLNIIYTATVGLIPTRIIRDKLLKMHTRIHLMKPLVFTWFGRKDSPGGTLSSIDVHFFEFKWGRFLGDTVRRKEGKASVS